MPRRWPRSSGPGRSVGPIASPPRLLSTPRTGRGSRRSSWALKGSTRPSRSPVTRSSASSSTTWSCSPGGAHRRCWMRSRAGWSASQVCRIRSKPSTARCARPCTNDPTGEYGGCGLLPAPRRARDDLALTRKHLLDERSVHLFVSVAAQILEDGDLVITIGGLAHRRQDNTTGRDAGEHEVADTSGTHNVGEVAAGECAHPLLSDENLAVPSSQAWVGLGLRPTEDHPTGGRDRSEDLVARGNLRIVRPKPDMDEDHRAARALATPIPSAPPAIATTDPVMSNALRTGTTVDTDPTLATRIRSVYCEQSSVCNDGAHREACCKTARVVDELGTWTRTSRSPHASTRACISTTRSMEPSEM